MKTTTNYKSFVLETNATLKNEVKSLQGAVKILVNMENLPGDVAKALRIAANNSGKPITTATSRNNIVVAIRNFAKGTSDNIMRKTTKAERAKGMPEQVAKESFSLFWVLKQLYKMNK